MPIIQKQTTNDEQPPCSGLGLNWEVVAEATGTRGTTFAILAELPDGSVRLRDRCAEGLTPDGTAIDAIYDSRMQAVWDAVKLVDLWVAPSKSKNGRG